MYKRVQYQKKDKVIHSNVKLSTVGYSHLLKALPRLYFAPYFLKIAPVVFSTYNEFKFLDINFEYARKIVKDSFKESS